MTEKLFKELEMLIDNKGDIEHILSALKDNPTYNISLFWFEDDLIPILINYYENKIEKINQKISKFYLSKIID